MFDVVPPSFSTPGPRRSSRRSVRRVRSPGRPEQPQLPAGPKRPAVIQLQWKLPARLRRPIHQELVRQKQQRRRQDTIIRFTRKPLVTTVPTTELPAALTPSRRLVQLPPPSYLGSFLKGGNSAQPVRNQPLVSRPPQGRRPASTPPTPRRIPPSPAKPLRRVMDAEVRMPLHMTVAPPEAIPSVLARLKKIFKNNQTTTSGGTGLGTQVLIFIVGCTLLAGGVWNLQAVGRGVAALDGVKVRAQGAYERLQLAQSAFAEADFSTSQHEFAAAHALLGEARSELETALAHSRFILETLDVTGTVRSGTNVLVTGEELTAAGEHLARGVGFLLQANVVEEKAGVPTLVDALRQARPELEAAHLALQNANAAVARVDGAQLPPPLSDHWRTIEEVVPRAQTALDRFLDQSSLLFSLLGADTRRQYLLVFENNHEIRPTGGFIGSVGLINVDNGVVENIDVRSVYDSDGQLKEFIAPPGPLTAIAPRWWLRDANWFVDYKVSAQKIAGFFEKSGGPTVDGVIALTPEVIRKLLEVTGPIEMPAYGVTVDATNFIPLTQQEVTYNYDREANRPKQFLADLTPVLLNRMFAQPSPKTWGSLTALMQMVQEKHLLLYFRNEELQQKIEGAGWAGRLPQTSQGFLSVNNANIGGHKSDQFIEQEIDYRLDVGSDGEAEVVVTVRRTHRGPQEALDYEYPPSEDPATHTNIVWQRVFVPPGATLVDAQGFSSAADVPREVDLASGVPLTADATVADWEQQQTRHPTGTTIGSEAGYTYFANWMITPPGATTVGLYRYRLPHTIAGPQWFAQYDRYSQYFIKQPGDTRTTIRAEMTLPNSKKIVNFVPEEGMTQTAPNLLVYRGALRQDKLIGFVFEKQ